MKKLLALVLTLVMAMSLMTISNAATFSDDANIDYKEAVEVMATVGVLAGDGTGAFDADGKLTRAAAAKIVTYLLVGADAAEGLTVSGATFTDVPADHWAAGYIGYLASEGVVAGVGDGKFAPNGEVTALQFAKMLLVALGYDADLEKLVGSDWSISTSKLAYDIGLFNGNDGVKVNTVATRQEAALYAFNALKTRYVEYATKGTTVTVGDAQVVTGAASAQENDDNGQNARGKFLHQKLYKNSNGNAMLVGSTVEDAFGAPASKWLFKGQEIGVFAKAPVATFSTEFTKNQMIDAVAAAGYSFDTSADGAAYDANLTTVVDGDVTGTQAPVAVDNWLKTNPKSAMYGNGVKVEFYANDDGYIYYMVVNNTYMADVATKKADKVATKTVDERELLVTYNSTTYSVNPDDTADFDAVYAAVEEGDKIAVYIDFQQGTQTDAVYDKAVTRAYVPTTVSGDVSYYSGTKATVAGTQYSYAANGADDGISAGDEGVTVYLDEFGYALFVEGGNTAAASLVVLDVYTGLNADGKLVDMLYVLYADGTTARVPAGRMNFFEDAYTLNNQTNAYELSAGLAGKIYLYDTNTDGQTCLVAAATTSAALDKTNKGQTYLVSANISEGDKGVTVGAGREYFADGAKFIYVDNTSGSYKFTVSDKLQDVTVNGTNAAGTGTAAAAAVIDADGNVATVYIVGAKAKNTIKDGSALIFIARQEGSAVGKDAEGNKVDLYTYTAFIDGVKVEGFQAAKDNANPVAAGFYESEYDSTNGWYTVVGNAYPDQGEDLQVLEQAAQLTADDFINDKFINIDNTDVELTSSTKYAAAFASNSPFADEEVGSVAEIKALFDGDTNDTVDVYVAYDVETGVALYVYVTAYTVNA